MTNSASREALQQKSWVERLIQKLFGGPKDREALVELLRGAKQRHLMEPDALPMIEGVLDIAELRVRDIMIPRVQMVVVSQDAELASIFPLVIETAHSRFPVIGEDRSEVVGILLAKDLLPHIRNDERLLVSEISRPAQFVPESKRLNVLLREFRTNRNHMAIVVDEYGMADGLITIEDVLEQIVGEIEDEHDFDDEEFVFRRGADQYTVKALMPIDEFNDYYSSSLSDDEFETIGGLIIHTFGYVPERGESVSLNDFRFEVLRSDNRRIHLLKLAVSQSHGIKNGSGGEEGGKKD